MYFLLDFDLYLWYNVKIKGIRMNCIYREFDGETIALWPDTIADMQRNCMSYLHVGQHGAANYKHVMKNSIPSKAEYIKILRKELLTRGYAKTEC